MKKFKKALFAICLSAMVLCGCSSSGVTNSSEATKENPMVLTLSHGLSESHYCTYCNDRICTRG